MTRDELKTWLASLDPMTDWDMDNIPNLEKQVVRVIKGSGFVNIFYLINKAE
jgi:hypothetical protein